jgi:hypothetical protein
MDGIDGMGDGMEARNKPSTGIDMGRKAKEAIHSYIHTHKTKQTKKQ